VLAGSQPGPSCFHLLPYGFVRVRLPLQEWLHFQASKAIYACNRKVNRGRTSNIKEGEMNPRLLSELEFLLETINPMTGISNPSDHDHCAGMFQQLTKQGISFDPQEIEEWLISQGGLCAKDARAIARMARRYKQRVTRRAPPNIPIHAVAGEAEWHELKDPGLLFTCLRFVGRDRQWRLFALACCRRILHFFPTDAAKELLDLAERTVDGLATETELNTAREAFAPTQQDGGGEEVLTFARKAIAAATGGIWPDRAAHDALAFAHSAFLKAQQTPDRLIKCRDESLQQSHLLRDIFGNPFRPIQFKQYVWLKPEVRTLAQEIYDNWAFGRLPELAGALRKARCRNRQILGHCLGPEPHVRGCWVLDLLLGKR
jgi:hypothetical protein